MHQNYRINYQAVSIFINAVIGKFYYQFHLIQIKRLPPNGPLLPWGLAYEDNEYCSWFNRILAEYYGLKGSIVMSSAKSFKPKK